MIDKKEAALTFLAQEGQKWDAAPTRTCGQCGTRSNHEGWCLVCGGSYAGSHDFHAKTFALRVADRISATRERIMGIQVAEAVDVTAALTGGYPSCT